MHKCSLPIRPCRLVRFRVYTTHLHTYLARGLTVITKVVPPALRLSECREGACEILLYQDEVYTRLINLSYNLQKFQEGWWRYLLS